MAKIFKKKDSLIFFLLTGFLLFLIFRPWFLPGLITAGDLSFFYPEQLRQYFNFPFTWETFRDAGLGGPSFLFQGVYLYNLPLGFLSHDFSYPALERIVWFWPLLILALFSPWFLAKTLNLFPVRFYPFSVLIFFLNTYFFMVMGGGQLTIILAYLFIPLTFAFFLRTFKETNLKSIILFSLSLAVLIAWDFRIAFIYFLVNLLYLFFLPFNFQTFKKLLVIYGAAFFINLGLHAFWLLPFILNFSNPADSLSPAYTTTEAVNFFSFADFSHSFSFLHPNWPENIFGKTYFMRWEFLTIPILAFSSLLFLRNRHSGEERNDDSRINNGFWTSQNDGKKASNMIHFFVLLGLVGAFLAKGSNEPFGEIYLWMFAHIPGFVMFRDPTKFYTMTALAYSVLIPYSMWKTYERLNFQFKVSISKLFLLLTTIYLLLLIRPAWIGELGGTFKVKEVPVEYAELKNFLAGQPEFFRTFWIPQKQRFAFYTDNHPGIDANYFLQTASASGIIEKLKNEENKKLLSLAGVKYVILPDDTEEEIFLKDRKYNPVEQAGAEKSLAKVGWLRKLSLSGLGKIAVYQNSNYRSRFWLENSQNSVRALEWQTVNPTKYRVSLKNLTEPVTLVFSENYNSGWKAKFGGKEITSQKIYGRFNSFSLPLLKKEEIIVEFKSQAEMYVGLVISFLTLLTTVFLLLKINRL